LHYGSFVGDGLGCADIADELLHCMYQSLVLYITTIGERLWCVHELISAVQGTPAGIEAQLTQQEKSIRLGWAVVRPSFVLGAVLIWVL